jgi:hypothetical protein
MTPSPRRTVRCILGIHRMAEVEHHHWECLRCWHANPACSNCGGEHDPTRVTVCVVSR